MNSTDRVLTQWSITALKLLQYTSALYQIRRSRKICQFSFYSTV